MLASGAPGQRAAARCQKAGFGVGFALDVPDPDRFGKPLQSFLAEVFELECFAQQVAGRLRDTDLAGLRNALQPGGEVAAYLPQFREIQVAVLKEPARTGTSGARRVGSSARSSAITLQLSPEG